MKIERIDHIHLHVRDLEKAIQRFEDLLGVRFGEVMSDELGADLLVKATYAPLGIDESQGIDVSQPTSPSSPVAKVIERKGEGLVGGVSFKVADIETAIAEFQAKGMKLLGRQQVGNLKQAWFHPRDAYGLFVEFCEYQAHNALAAARGES
ncbi:VOC family protein [Chloroflexota bacterium]